MKLHLTYKGERFYNRDIFKFANQNLERFVSLKGILSQGELAVLRKHGTLISFFVGEGDGGERQGVNMVKGEVVRGR